MLQDCLTSMLHDASKLGDTADTLLEALGGWRNYRWECSFVRALVELQPMRVVAIEIRLCVLLDCSTCMSYGTSKLGD